MAKYKVNGGDKSERGDEVISPEVEQNPLRDKRERGMDTYGNIRSRLGTQLGVRITDPNSLFGQHGGQIVLLHPGRGYFPGGWL